MLVCTTRHLAASDRHKIWRLAMAFHQLLTVQNVINITPYQNKQSPQISNKFSVYNCKEPLYSTVSMELQGTLLCFRRDRSLVKKDQTILHYKFPSRKHATVTFHSWPLLCGQHSSNADGVNWQAWKGDY